jgi:phospholipid/cholesterol/gamma-HCH transport system substrate-binding protein
MTMNIRVPRTPKAIGWTVMAFLVALALYAFNQPAVLTTLSSGEDLKATFTRDYQLVPDTSLVKVAGVKVGTVTGTSATASDQTLVDMKLQHGTLAKLGTSPRAIVRPSTLLGGKYYVELVRDGKEGQPAAGSTIPVSRTAVPVELDKVLSTITPDASHGIRRTVTSLDQTLAKGGRRQVQRFLGQAPQALKPTGVVLRALEGTSPRTDLPNIVQGLRSTAASLNQQQDEVGTILDGLDRTSQGFSDARVPLAQTIANAPSTLRATQRGLASLAPTLDQLGTTAKNFQPSAQQLSSVLTALGPVVIKARPVLADARAVARDARPLVGKAVPTVRRATGVLSDVKGAVLGRLDGPIKAAVLSPWHGTGVYHGGGNDHLLYQETGYLLANTADVFKFHDHNGAMGRLMAGVGVSSVGGVVSMSVPEYLQDLGVGAFLPGSSTGALGTLGTLGSHATTSTTKGNKSPLSGLLSNQSGGLLTNLLSILGGHR